MNNAKNIYSKKNEAEVKRKQAQHRKNLANMRCSIDNKPPVRYRHLQRNMKKEQLMVSANTHGKQGRGLPRIIAGA